MTQTGLWRRQLILQEMLQTLGLDPKTTSTQEVFILNHNDFLMLLRRLCLLDLCCSLPDEQIPRFRHYDSIISVVW